jgi:hypothetical protein
MPHYGSRAPAVAQAIAQEDFDVVRQRIPLLFDSSGDQGWRHWFKLTGRHTGPANQSWNYLIPTAGYRQ